MTCHHPTLYVTDTFHQPIAMGGECLFCVRDALAARLAEAERDDEQTMKERDYNAEMADKLAAAISTLTGVDIGEHSSGNCPWHAALEAAEEYGPTDSAEDDSVVSTDAAIAESGVGAPVCNFCRGERYAEVREVGSYEPCPQCLEPGVVYGSAEVGPK